MFIAERPSIIRRLGAFYIDSIIVMFPIFLIIMYFDIKLFSFEFVMAQLVSILPLMCKDLLFKGRSLGKLLLGLVVRNSTDPDTIPSTKKLIIRNIFIGLIPLEALVYIISGCRKKLGDYITNTEVFVLNSNI